MANLDWSINQNFFSTRSVCTVIHQLDKGSVRNALFVFGSDLNVSESTKAIACWIKVQGEEENSNSTLILFE
jgi:hypothetical protein